MMTSMKTTPWTSDTAAAIYNDAMTRVGTLLGKDFRIVTPVANHERSTGKAEVNIFPLMASFLTLAQFGDNNKRLWSLIKKKKLKDTLFPSTHSHPTLGMKSAMEALKALDHLCSVDGIQVITRGKSSDPGVTKLRRGTTTGTPRVGRSVPTISLRLSSRSSPRATAWIWQRPTKPAGRRNKF